MSVQQLTEFLDDLYTSTWQNMSSDVADQVFDATPFWAWMKENGRLDTEEGGRWIGRPLQYDKNDNIYWIRKGSTVQLNDFKHLTTVKYDWRYLVASMVRFGVDDQQNRGKNTIIKFAESKVDNTKMSLADELETRLFGGVGDTDPEHPAFHGLQVLVADDPTASQDIGGYNQQDYDWWRNQANNMTGVSFATSGVSRMRTMFNDCMQNKKSDAPDIIVSGQTPYEYYEDEAFDKLEIQSTKLAEMGFDTQTFKGRPWVWSPACANTRIYFLNTNYLQFIYDPIMYFEMTAWKDIPDQVNDRAAQIITACQLITNRRRVHGVIHTIDTE